MRRYPASLAAWRASLPADPAPQLRLYLRVFAAVLDAMQARRERRMSYRNQYLTWNTSQSNSDHTININPRHTEGQTGDVATRGHERRGANACHCIFP